MALECEALALALTLLALLTSLLTANQHISPSHAYFHISLKRAYALCIQTVSESECSAVTEMFWLHALLIFSFNCKSTSPLAYNAVSDSFITGGILLDQRGKPISAISAAAVQNVRVRYVVEFFDQITSKLQV